ncbi:MAG TPA: hypothetical protein VLH56_18135 [Dissulfurispiraceae bacterium]|nr:hypothetical protein [Dissulfurispiraceae bacterium]
MSQYGCPVFYQPQQLLVFGAAGLCVAYAARKRHKITLLGAVILTLLGFLLNA